MTDPLAAFAVFLRETSRRPTVTVVQRVLSAAALTDREWAAFVKDETARRAVERSTVTHAQVDQDVLPPREVVAHFKAFCSQSANDMARQLVAVLSDRQWETVVRLEQDRRGDRL